MGNQMDTNFLKNKDHYETVYGREQVDSVIRCVRSIQTFLPDAIRTDTSWHGLYQNDFQNMLPGKKVLELGCGNGLNALIMAALGADVIAIDIADASKDIIEHANKALGTTVQALVGDLSEIDLPLDTFDYVVGKAFLHHLTHEQEKKYLSISAKLLKTTGEARFFEPAINSKMIDTLRWIIPVPGRPSILNQRTFQVWKENDPHPIRDHTTAHYLAVAKLFFGEVSADYVGSLERLHRLLPSGTFNRGYRRWAHRTENFLPHWFRHAAARSQVLIFQQPVK